MYPAFVNCTTIDWFSEWPVDALLEVADKYLSEESLGSEEEVRFYIAECHYNVVHYHAFLDIILSFYGFL